MARLSTKQRQTAAPVTRRRTGAMLAVASQEESWMTTYSDLVTLLLTFFVALYAFSRVDAVKFQQLVRSVRSSLGVNLDRQGGLPDVSQSPWLLKEANEREQLEQVLQRLRQTLPEEGSGLSLVQEQRGIVVRFADQALFDTGKADLRPSAEPVLRRLAETLRPLENPLRVEGHTDSVPIHTVQFPSNWELSTARASRVVRFLIEQGIPLSRLSAAGYADQRPVASNATAAGRAQNRRVDLVILSLSELSSEPPLP